MTVAPGQRLLVKVVNTGGTQISRVVTMEAIIATHSLLWILASMDSAPQRLLMNA